MQPSSESVQVYSGSKFNNVVLKQVNADRWSYFIKPKTYISIAGIIIALSFIPILIAFGEVTIPWTHQTFQHP